jgi:hypothetical protein
MRTKIFLIHFGPVVFFTVLTIIGFLFNIHFNKWVAFGLTFGSIIRLLYVDRKYVSTFEIVGNTLLLSYYSIWFKNTIVDFTLSDVEKIEVTKSNWIAEYPAAVAIKVNNTWHEFQIISGAIKRIIIKQTHSSDQDILD